MDPTSHLQHVEPPETSNMIQKRYISSRIAGAAHFLRGSEIGAGILLICAAALALGLSNSALAPEYDALFHAPLGWTPVAKLDTLHLWINDAAMAVFFFVVGLEIKREILDGELSSPARRRLPVAAALAGMAAPALIYLAVAGTTLPLQRGWAIPAATDIAFAMGVVGLLGNRVPAPLRLFLLTVAIVDDLGAVTIIAVFYTAQLKLGWLAAAIVVLAGMIALNLVRISRRLPFLLLAGTLWFCVLHSGIHPTIAGVLAAFTIPLRIGRTGDSMLLRLEHALVPWSGFVIVPLFGFANAGVSLAGIGFSGLFAALPLGIALGLFIGKQMGIFLALVVAKWTGFAELPTGTTWLQAWGMAALAGIGFTMSLFIGALAFPRHPLLVEEAKLGVLAGSLASALLGYAILRLTPAKGA